MSLVRSGLALAAALHGAVALGCARDGGAPHVGSAEWRPLTALEARLPGAVRVFELEDEALGLHAWYVRVDPRDPGVEVRVLVSDDGDRRETVSSLARESGALVAVNGGYFGVRDGAGNPHGLVVADGEIVKPPWRVVRREGETYPVARAALGLDATGRPDVAWVSRRGPRLLEWPEPFPNRPGAPCAPPDADAALARPWSPREAVQGGPSLLSAGEASVTAREEVCPPRLLGRHPRTAAGVTAAGELVLMVVDGRQRESRGVDLEELALLLRDVGCVEALNLDGGGSSTLVVCGERLNDPEGGDEEREVVTAIGIFAR